MRRLLLLLIGALAVAAPAIGSAPAPSPPHLGRGPDHVMMWVRDARTAARNAEARLGFRVTPGGDFGDGVANHLIQFSDRSYLELLFFTLPREQVTPEMLRGLDFLATANGSNGFGIHVPSLEQTAERLGAAGFAMAAPSAGVWDPDGPGPRPSEASMFRTMNFRQPPVPGFEAFFVWYRPGTRWTAQQQASFDRRTGHPNTARRLTAVWFATAQPAAAGQALERMGMVRVGARDLPHLGARAVAFATQFSHVLVMEPAGAGPIAEALRRRGPHVAGVSIEVADLATARSTVARGYGRALPLRRGPFGRGFVAPTLEDFGLLIEFHEAPR